MKIQFPPELLKIEKWYAFKGRYPPNSMGDHRIIIIYKHEGFIKYFYVTSRVEKARKLARDDIGSLVDKITGSDWDVLTKESCILCNLGHLYLTEEDALRGAYAEGKIEVLGKVPEVIKRAIVSAVCASKSFTDAEKKKYTV